MTNKTCASCGTDFTCGIESGNKTCWCFDLPNIIAIEAIDSVDTASDCLCPDCLQVKIDKAQEQSSIDKSQ